jgi:hypothetical protein
MELLLAICIVIAGAIIIAMMIERDRKQKELEEIQDFYKTIDVHVEATKRATTLERLFYIHKSAWAEGIRNDNLGPCIYGMFRTADINDMTKDEVYLGNINGLFTQPLTFWESQDDQDAYKTVFRQYQLHLLTNFKAVKLSKSQQS